MSAVAVQDISHSRVIDGDIEFELDDQGMPIMPEWLQEFANMTLRSNGKKTKELAQAVYDRWKQNDFKNVNILLDRTTRKPECQSNLSQARNFDDEEPILDDYLEDCGDPDQDTDHESNSRAMFKFDFDQAVHEIRKAYAKAHCVKCPLMMDCLASSLTQPSYDRSGKQKATRVGYTDNGIHGGYGPGARQFIHRRMVDIWCKPENEWDYSSDYILEVAESGVDVPADVLAKAKKLQGIN